MNGEGRLRTGWRLCVCLLAYIALRLAVREGLNAFLSALFRGWGISAASVRRAPAWARLVYAWQGSGVTALVSGATLALSMILRRRLADKAAIKPSKKDRSLFFGWLTGAGVVLMSAGLFLILDSMRLEWPLSEPRFGVGTAALVLLSLLSVAAEEAFGKGVVFEIARDGWGSGWATLFGTLFFFLSNGGFAGGWLCALNVLLLGSVCCGIYRRYGIQTTVGFRWGWSCVTTLLLGFGGGDWAVYRLYHVSEGWLTGGNAGPVCGAWMALPLLCLALWLFRDVLRNPFVKRDRDSLKLQ